MGLNNPVDALPGDPKHLRDLSYAHEVARHDDLLYLLTDGNTSQ